MQRVIRLLSLVLVLHLMAFAGVSDCAMSAVSQSEAQATQHEGMIHAKASSPGKASSLLDAAAHCNMSCGPDACANGSHCTSASEVFSSGAGIVHDREAGKRALAALDAASVIHTPDPPPPRA
jgi:hypothetical protein